MQQKKSYSLIRYAECVGIVIFILEITANTNAGEETSRIKHVTDIIVPSNLNNTKSIIKRIRNKFVHNSMDFISIKQLLIDSEIGEINFARLIKFYADYIGLNITYDELYDVTHYIYEFIKFMVSKGYN